LLRTAREQRVVDHQDLRLEQRRVAGTCRLCDAVANLAQLGARLRPRGLQPLPLAIDGALRDPVADVARLLPRDNRAAGRNARRDAGALDVHASSNPRSASPASAWMASSSSSPSAAISMVVPRPADNSSSPR